MHDHLEAFHAAEVDGIEDGRPKLLGIARGGQVQA